MAIWSVYDVNDQFDYRLELCQRPSGKRYFRLRLAEGPEDASLKLNKEGVLLTEIVPRNLLRSRDLEGISKAVLLVGGERFCVDAHGIWLTAREFEQMQAFTPPEKIVWSTSVPPIFAER